MRSGFTITLRAPRWNNHKKTVRVKWSLCVKIQKVYFTREEATIRTAFFYARVTGSKPWGDATESWAFPGGVDRLRTKQYENDS